MRGLDEVLAERDGRRHDLCRHLRSRGALEHINLEEAEALLGLAMVDFGHVLIRTSFP